ncbi:MAG: hypothetical protein WA919_16465 [Coleofasciculaceae cyanobacterium]
MPIRSQESEARSQNSSTFPSVLLDKFLDGVRYAPSCQLLQLSQKRCTEPLQTAPSKHLFAIQNPTEDLTFANIE